MKAFRFGLQRVLEWRRVQLEQAENRLRQLLAGRELLDRERSRLNDDRDAAGRQLLAAGALTGEDLEMLDGYRRAVDCRLRTLARQRQEQQALITAQQQKRAEALQHYRLLEKLRDRHLEEWRGQVDRETEAGAAETFLARRKQLDLNRF